MPRHATFRAFIAVAAILTTVPLSAQPRGSIAGAVGDARTKHALPGATVFIQSLDRGAASGSDGRFSIDNLPAGAYVLRFTFVGYEAVTRTDVVVRPDRITYVDAELEPAVLGGVEAVVTAGAFSGTRNAVSITARDAEEIRRAPGAAGDVSRAMSSLPSVAKVNDLRNGLVVRGGSPVENAFYVDGIQIQNINHFPTQGSSGGAIGLINPDLIRDVQFQSGGFSSSHGNRLSSVMDITFRDGNRDETEMQLDLNLGGFGFVAEGPLDSNGSSWILSARRSYLDFLVNHLMGDEVDAVPIYGDVQGKAVANLSPKSRLSLLGILGIDISGIDRESAIDEDENTFGDADYTLGSIGLSWRYLIGTKGFITTYASFGSNRSEIDSFETLTGRSLHENHSRESVLRFRQVTSLVSGDHSVEFGADAEFEFGDYELLFAAETDPFGQAQPALQVHDRIRTGGAGVFGTYSLRLLPALSISPGFRVDYGSANGQVEISPRLAATLDVDLLTSFSLAGGKYVQRLPAALLAQSPSHNELPDMTAWHAVASASRLLNEDTKLTVEGFLKEYRDFPVDPTQPALFMMDELFYTNGSFESFGGHPAIEPEGYARSLGVETMVQKKLAERIYGLASASFSRSRYRDLETRWRPRVTDNRLMATVQGGYKPNERWEFSLRWLYAGGAPYTPFDEEASAEAQTGIYDDSLINGLRMPDYHSLSIRFDRRFHFRSSSLIVYLSVWNVYGRHNVAGYYWNEVDARVQEVEQFGTLPILGLEFEF
ncbi:MAG TPA: TonB-dependent receptor [Rhodothermales bacterium]|nr:TonB-dependent receptor [Rhodothermales bacterium]